MSKRFTIIAATVFALGLIAGAYLVLRTTVTSGEIETSTPLSAGKTSDELLDELLKLNREEAETKTAYVPPEERNITDEFLSTVISSVGLTSISAKKIQSSDFLVETVLPYLKSSEIDLLPMIPTSALKISTDSPTSYKKYFNSTNKETERILGTITKILDVDLEKLGDSGIQNNLASYSKDLENSFKNISEIEVPPKYLALHKNLVVSIIGAKKITEVMIAGTADPLKVLMTLGQIESLALFWQQTLSDYAKVSTAKR